MNKYCKLALIILVILSMIKPSFISASDEPIVEGKATVTIPVSVSGAEGTVQVIPWVATEIGDKRYSPGPPLEISSKKIGEYTFKVDINVPGNYVYEVSQIRDDSTIKYDVDLSNTSETIKVYRVFVSVIFDEERSTDTIQYIDENFLMEVQECNDYACDLEPEDIETKPEKISFVNEKIPTPSPWNIPNTGITLEDIIVTGGICSEFLIIFVLLFKRKKKTEN